MGVIERKLRQKENIRSGILQAARSVALKEGWQAVTIRKIADDIEYTPPIVYEYFENKEAVLLAIAMEGAETLLDMIAKVDQALDAEVRLFQFARVHWEFASQYPEVYKLMFGFEGLPSHPEARPKIATEIRSYVLSTLGEISHIENEKELEELSFNWVCILHGFTSLIMLAQSRKKELPNFQPEKILENFTNRFIKGIS